MSDIDTVKSIDIAQRISEQVIAYVDVHATRLAENLARVNNLMTIYKDLYGKRRGRKHVHAIDVLRAAVVLLHASLEDFLRSLAAAHLPKAPAGILDSVPIVGSEGGRPEKFLLGRLAPYRGRTVDDLIEDSVKQYLERSNYNSTQEVTLLLRGLGVDVSKVNHTFPSLDRLMQRRHQIVHRADRIEPRGRGRQQARSLSVATVQEWANATRTFMTKTLAQLSVAQVHEFLESSSSQLTQE